MMMTPGSLWRSWVGISKRLVAKVNLKKVCELVLSSTIPVYARITALLSVHMHI